MSFNHIDLIDFMYERRIRSAEIKVEQTIVSAASLTFTSYGVEWKIGPCTTTLIPWSRVISLTQVDTRDKD